MGQVQVERRRQGQAVDCTSRNNSKAEAAQALHRLILMDKVYVV
jgi:hypothetical protein